MRSCEDFERLASLAVDNEASEMELAELTEHLESCPACRAYFEDIKRIRDAFSLEAAALPEGFAAGVMDRVRETPQEQPEKTVCPPRWRRWVPGAALAACCALAMLGIWRLDTVRVASRSVTTDCAMDNTAMAEPAGQAEDALELDDAATRKDAMAAPADAGEGAPADSPAEAAPADAKEEAITGRPAEDTAPTAPAPAMLPPSAQRAEYSGGPGTAAEGETVMLTAGGPTAAAWVEEHLGTAWEEGEVWYLTENQYLDLRAALESAGEDFTEEVLGTSRGVWLLSCRTGNAGLS